MERLAHIPAPEAFAALRVTIEEQRDRLFAVLRHNDPLWISGLRTKFIETEKKYARSGDYIQRDIYRALQHAALRLHEVAQYNKAISDECFCFDQMMITSCRCPFQQVDLNNENALFQEVITDVLVKDWERRGVAREQALVAVALNNPFLLVSPLKS